MSWLDLPRVPEPEVMDDSDEVDAYALAAAQAFLDHIDDTFVDHALRLVRGRPTAAGGRALDIGTGPGQIILKLFRRLPAWHFTGVDRSANMIKQARASVAQALLPVQTAGTDQGTQTGCRVSFFVADGNRLPFPDASFDVVMCNSVLHHLAEPQHLFSEVARLVKPDGAILIRDLRRPSRLAYPLHVRWHGRHYSGLMYKLYCASVRAAYTLSELEAMLRASPLTASGARVFTHHRTHLGLERPAKN